jgi:hypothetical protein
VSTFAFSIPPERSNKETLLVQELTSQKQAKEHLLASFAFNC